MTYARCPFCPELLGPLLNALLVHLRDVHQRAVEWVDASTGSLKLAGWLPGSIDFVEVGQ